VRLRWFILSRFRKLYCELYALDSHFSAVGGKDENDAVCVNELPFRFHREKMLHVDRWEKYQQGRESKF
jgi:hypothetical protein